MCGHKAKSKKNTATLHQKIKFVLGDYMKIVIWWGNKPFGGEGSTGGFFLVGRNKQIFSYWGYSPSCSPEWKTLQSHLTPIAK